MIKRVILNVCFADWEPFVFFLWRSHRHREVFPNVTCPITFYTIKIIWPHFNLLVNAKNWSLKRLRTYLKVWSTIFSARPGGGSRLEGKASSWGRTCELQLDNLWSHDHEGDVLLKSSLSSRELLTDSTAPTAGLLHACSPGDPCSVHTQRWEELWETRSRESCLCSSWLLTRWGRTGRWAGGCTCRTLVTHTVD